MASISPTCKKCKNFILAPMSPTYIDFMIKKSLKSKTSKSHTWAPLMSFLSFSSDETSFYTVLLPHAPCTLANSYLMQEYIYRLIQYTIYICSRWYIHTKICQYKHIFTYRLIQFYINTHFSFGSWARIG